jgi:hypothetical protein
MEKREEEAHDVLAAEEFGIGDRDDRYPRDPTGLNQAHDVLAAEEHPMPLRDDRYDTGGGARGGIGNLAPFLVLGAVILLILRRRRS